MIVNASRRCDFNGCTDPVKYEVCVRAWPTAECVPGEEMTFRFKKVCCSKHRLSPGPVFGLLSESLRSQMNWGLLSTGRKPRDFNTAKFVFEPLEVINNNPRGLH
jgi:hypothetical protein